MSWAMRTQFPWTQRVEYMATTVWTRQREKMPHAQILSELWTVFYIEADPRNTYLPDEWCGNGLLNYHLIIIFKS